MPAFKRAYKPISPSPSRPNPVLEINVNQFSWFMFISDTSSTDRKSTRLNSRHLVISYAVFCLTQKLDVGHRRLPRRLDLDGAAVLATVSPASGAAGETAHPPARHRHQDTPQPGLGPGRLRQRE